ncbi:hypothetical protein SKAU_G00128330 [Synaphobranchus kaupii]|uniref:Uncharacterized protein n=1 Tax=Synaphobranchus kaupii TaxID=118154 RepID=A0A9Q1FQW1_SYNKA|nr:hypothetical protein SKAU_G00128330 [Synaphobranchus kaupii]
MGPSARYPRRDYAQPRLINNAATAERPVSSRETLPFCAPKSVPPSVTPAGGRRTWDREGEQPRAAAFCLATPVPSPCR